MASELRGLPRARQRDLQNEIVPAVRDMLMRLGNAAAAALARHHGEPRKFSQCGRVKEAGIGNGLKAGFEDGFAELLDKDRHAVFLRQLVRYETEGGLEIAFAAHRYPLQSSQTHVSVALRSHKVQKSPRVPLQHGALPLSPRAPARMRLVTRNGGSEPGEGFPRQKRSE